MRLSYKIIVLVISLTILFAITSTFIVSRVIQDRIRGENLQWSQVLADSLAVAISEFVVDRDVFHVRSVLNDLIQRRDKIGYAYVTDFDGDVMTHTFKDGFPRVLLEQINDKHYRYAPFELETVSGSYLDVSYHLIEDMKAHIHIGIDRDAEIQLLRNVRRDIVLVSLMIGLVGALLALFLGRRLTRPLASLADNIIAYSQGEYRAAKLTGSSDVEINKVSRAFNDMLEKRKESEAEQRRLMSILDVTPDLVGIADKEGKTLYLNRAGRELMGFSGGEDLSGIPLSSYHPEDVAELITAEGIPTAKKEGRWINETPFLARDGQLFVTSQVLLAHKSTDGAIEYFSTVARDITEQKAAENLQKRLGRLLDQSFNEIYVFDAQSLCFTQVNLGARENLGYSMDELMCMTPVDIKPEFDRKRFSQLIQPLRDGIQRKIQFETEHERKNGTLYPVAVNLQLINEEPPVFIAVIEDITERKKAERALRESEQRFQTMARVSPVGIFQTDQQGQCLYVNKRWTEIAGIDAEQALGNGWSNALHPLDRERVYTEWISAAESKTPFRSEYRYKRPDNSFAWVFGQAAAVYDDHDALSGYVGTITDISERKQVEQELLDYKLNLEKKVEQRTDELKEINRELEAFSYSVSHDLRTPLRSVAGFSQMLVEDYKDKLDDTANDYLSRISAGAKRMGILIDDLLQLSRTGREEMKYEEIDLSALAGKLVEELRQADPERQVEVRIAQGARAMGDHLLLSSVLQNLLGNAWKFTRFSENASIEFDYELQGDSIVCYVKDNGVGFNMKYADKLFGVFQRLHADTRYQGTGVGLAIVQRIIHRHEGKVWAESEEGKGATFFFTLQAVTADRAVAAD